MTEKQRYVSDEEWLEASRNSDNQGILKSLARMTCYTSVLNDHEIESCLNYSLWNALRYHNPPPGSSQKFTTSLHMFAKYALNRARRKAVNARKRGGGEHSPIPEGLPDSRVTTTVKNEKAKRLAKDFLALLPSYKHRKALKLRHLDGKTYEEISSELSVTMDGARKLVSEAEAELRERCSIS